MRARACLLQHCTTFNTLTALRAVRVADCELPEEDAMELLRCLPVRLTALELFEEAVSAPVATMLGRFCKLQKFVLGALGAHRGFLHLSEEVVFVLAKQL